jgi:hypothetical protein
MKRILGAALLLQLAFFVPAHAQFQNIESKYLGQLRSKTLLVPTVEPDTRTLIDLKKTPEDLDRYNNGIANYNEALKNAVDKYAKFAKNVEYLPQSKVNAILKEGNTKYIVLQHSLYSGTIKPTMYADMYADKEYTSERRKISGKEGYGVFNLLMPVKDKDPEVIYAVYLPVAYPSPGDMIYAVQMISNQMATMQKNRTYQVSEFNAEIGKNNKSLKNKTLFIDNSQLEDKADINELTKAYPYNIKVVDYQEINRAIEENDSTVAYVQVVPMEMPENKANYGKIKTPVMHLVLNAANGEVLAKSRVTRMDYDKLANDISRKEIDDYVLKESMKPEPKKEQPAKEEPKKGQPLKEKDQPKSKSKK